MKLRRPYEGNTMIGPCLKWLGKPKPFDRQQPKTSLTSLYIFINRLQNASALFSLENIHRSRWLRKGHRMRRQSEWSWYHYLVEIHVRMMRTQIDPWPTAFKALFFNTKAVSVQQEKIWSFATLSQSFEQHVLDVVMDHVDRKEMFGNGQNGHKIFCWAPKIRKADRKQRWWQNGKLCGKYD